MALVATITTPLHADDGALSPTGLKVEYGANPLGIDTVTPRLSWHSSAQVRAARQTAYRIQAAATAADLDAGKLLWDSGQVKSDQALFVPYKGPALASGDQVIWRVMLWDQDGQPSPWSASAFWEMGLLSQNDWRARWIKPAGTVDTSAQRPVALFRKPFTLTGEIVSARLYATARGIYELELNGKAVGDQVLAPGWTSYRHRIQYQTYDVTALLKTGDNAIGAQLADGWYRGHLGWDGKRNTYGDETALLAQLHVTYRDGREDIIATDESWKASTDGPYRMADLYDGEIYDARKAMADWSTSGFDDSSWQSAAIFVGENLQLIAPQGPPVKKIEELRPVSITKSPNGEILVDMGQNMVGWVKLKVKGAAGTEVVIRHAEVLDPDGNLYIDNLRTADATNKVILAGAGVETYEPQFTFHGFRYVGISGYSGELTADDITGVVVHSEMARTGHWESSAPLLNKLYSNILWGQKGNFLDVPTDCPQRDERLGWTGDAQVFAPTAAFNMNVSGFFAKWLRDLDLDQQQRNGSVPFVIPDIFDASGAQGMPQHGTAGWSDAATVIPWTMYEAYGDEELLRQQFSSMKAWVDYVGTKADDDHIWRPGFQFGDWLAPELKPHPQLPTYQARTETDLIATAYYARSADLVARAAAVLGTKAEARHYRQLFESIRTAFQREFTTANARLVYATQTAYVLALAFDLLPEADRQAAAKHLAADVRERGYHLTTGFLGTPDLTRVLSDYGQTGTAYKLLNQTTYPSWLFPVTFGATTIWERWDAIRPDGTFQNPEMTSFNHYAYGAVGQWMVNTVAGLNAAEPGYKRLLIQPRPGGGLTNASASLDTPYGKASSAWSVKGETVTIAVDVAANTSATLVLPLAVDADVTEAGVALRQAAGVNAVVKAGDDLSLDVGSGSYSFSYNSAELALLAADYQPFSEATPIMDMVKDSEVKALFTAHLPEALAAPLFSAAATTPLSELLKNVAYRQAVEAVLKALPAINARRRAQVLERHDAN